MAISFPRSYTQYFSDSYIEVKFILQVARLQNEKESLFYVIVFGKSMFMSLLLTRFDIDSCATNSTSSIICTNVETINLLYLAFQSNAILMLEIFSTIRVSNSLI